MAREFDIIKTEDMDHLKKTINKKLKDGWKLNGNTYVFPVEFDSDGAVRSFTYVQALSLDKIEMGDY